MARIYQTPLMGEAHIRVALVEDRGRADLLVRRVESWGLARGDALWFITRDKQDATAWVYFGEEGFAEVLICFVEGYGETGWQRPHRCRGRFG